MEVPCYYRNRARKLRTPQLAYMIQRCRSMTTGALEVEADMQHVGRLLTLRMGYCYARRMNAMYCSAAGAPPGRHRTDNLTIQHLMAKRPRRCLRRIPFGAHGWRTCLGWMNRGYFRRERYSHPLRQVSASDLGVAVNVGDIPSFAITWPLLLSLRVVELRRCVESRLAVRGGETAAVWQRRQRRRRRRRRQMKERGGYSAERRRQVGYNRTGG